MKTIWRYTLSVQDINNISIPANGRILYVGSTNDQNPVLWIEVDTKVVEEIRYFRIYGTGHPHLEDDIARKYVGTVIVNRGNLVWHVYEEFPKT
jgi:hypothetical protein